MTKYVYKLKNGKEVSAYADENGNMTITKEALEIMANSWNDGYQKGRAAAINEYRDKLIEAFTPLVEDEWIENETVIADVKMFAEQLKKDNA